MADAAGDDFGKGRLTLIAEKATVIRGDGLEIVCVVWAEGFVASERFFKMAARPGAITRAEEGEGEIIMGLGRV